MYDKRGTWQQPLSWPRSKTCKRLLSKFWVLTIMERNIINSFGYKQTMTPFLGISSPKEWATSNRQQTRDPGLHSARLRNLGQGQGLKHGSSEYLSLYKRKKIIGSGVPTLTPVFGVISQDQRTSGPVNAHLMSWPSKVQNIQNLEIYGKEMTLTFNTYIPSYIQLDDCSY